MKLYFKWRMIQSDNERCWLWRINDSSQVWVITPDDTTTGTLAWLRSYVK